MTSVQNEYNPKPWKGGELFFNLAVLIAALLVFFCGYLPDSKLSTWDSEKWQYMVVYALLLAGVIGNYVRVRYGKKNS